MLHALVSAENGLVKAERLAVFAALMGLVVVLFLQVTFRFVIERPLAFTEELSRILLIWLVFLGAAYGSFLGQHFMVDFIVRALPKPLHRIIDPLIDFVTIAFLGALLWIGYQSALNATVQRLPVLGVPVVVQIAAMPVGALLMIFHTLMIIARRRAGLEYGDAAVAEVTAHPPASGGPARDRSPH